MIGPALRFVCWLSFRCRSRLAVSVHNWASEMFWRHRSARFYCWHSLDSWRHRPRVSDRVLPLVVPVVLLSLFLFLSR